jgi:hypothetical protein
MGSHSFVGLSSTGDSGHCSLPAETWQLFYCLAVTSHLQRQMRTQNLNTAKALALALGWSVGEMSFRFAERRGGNKQT